MFTVVEDIIKSDDPIPGPVKEITGSSGSLLLMREAVTAEENGSSRHVEKHKHVPRRKSVGESSFLKLRNENECVRSLA